MTREALRLSALAAEVRRLRAAVVIMGVFCALSSYLVGIAVGHVLNLG